MSLSFSYPEISTDKAIEWDGHKLKITLPVSSFDLTLELLIDGTRYQERSIQKSTDSPQIFQFLFSPSGRADIEFDLLLQSDNCIFFEKKFMVIYGEKRACTYPSLTDYPLKPLLDTPASSRIFTSNKFLITIIVPIYNAATAVSICLQSIVKYTRGAVKLILIDDASTEPAIAPLLDLYRDQPRIQVLSNNKNLGYTRTINRGLLEAGECDVVILNADTEVGPNWLQGLVHAAYSQPEIGTATAVSNNAGAFSVPELEQENPLPKQWTFEQSARACWQQAGLVYPVLPTGNGFCMYIKAEVIKHIGYFDEIAFPQGYGEENDFCMRAQKTGYRHVIAGNVLVRHARSQSFGVERRLTLGQAGMAVLRQRYPDYETQVGATLFSFERLVLNWRIRRTWQDADNIYQLYPPRSRVLFYKNNPCLSDRFLKRFEAWRLTCIDSEWNLERYDQTGWSLEQYVKCESEEEKSVIANWVVHYAIEILCLSKFEQGQKLAWLHLSPQGPPICLLDDEDIPDFSLVEKLNRCVEDALSFAAKKPGEHHE